MKEKEKENAKRPAARSGRVWEPPLGGKAEWNLLKVGKKWSMLANWLQT